MRRVGIVTDSTACIPQELGGTHQIEILPLDLEFADRVYKDGLEITSAAFYEQLRSARRPPTTGAPPPGVYAEAIVRAAHDADAVLCLTVSRQFSAMYDAAIQGARLVRAQTPALDVRVLDTGAAAMAQGFVALEAAREAQAGAPLDRVVARAEELMPRVQLLVALDTLTYLARSGRVPRLLAWAASPLHIKPIVQFQRGAYRPLAIARTMPRAIDRLVLALQRQQANGALHACVHHTNVPVQAKALAERIHASLQPAELLIAEFTQVMGVHTGPGLLGLAWYTES